MIQMGVTAQPKLLWECFGRLGGVFPPDRCMQLEGLECRPELNGRRGEVLDWDAESGRFVVCVAAEKIKVKPANLQAKDTGSEGWARSEAHLGLLPASVALRVGLALPARGCAALSTASRALRLALWQSCEAQSLWVELAQRGLGGAAVVTVRRARVDAAGPVVYRIARGLKRLFEKSFELVEGGVDRNAKGFTVVACPVARNLLNMDVGAQGAVRRAAGRELEDAIAQLQRNWEPIPVTLVTGGQLSEKVALTLTEIPATVLRVFQNYPSDEADWHTALMSWLDGLHDALLSAVRAAGHRSVAMPTLCTGGIGIPVQFVGVAAARSVYRDFLASPADPLRVRICCFEPGHHHMVRAVKDEIVDNFYRPESAEDLVALLQRSTREGRPPSPNEDPISEDDLMMAL